MPTVEQLRAGYGDGFPSLEELFGLQPSDQELLYLNAPTPGAGRYHQSTEFLSGVTSDAAVGITRFRVIVEAFIALSDELTFYNGLHAGKKVVHSLTDADKSALRSLATSVNEVYQAQRIERFTEHDTAAAGDLMKLLIATQLPHLQPMIEGVCFGATSEDTMGPVFGLVANCLVFGNFIPRLLDFMETCLIFVEYCESGGPLVIPAETHEQAAEPTTFGKRVLTNLAAVNYHLHRLQSGDYFIPFTGKFGGAVGNLTNLYAAYPDIDWRDYARRLIEDRLGLTYEELTFQCSIYALEASHFTTIANMLTPLIKLVEDFLDSASCPKQLFVKRKIKGTKGSSVMPNKSNGWGQEGAVAMLQEARHLLFHLAQSLPDFPREGNMGRSYLMRSLGTYFAPIFIALGRIRGEMIGDMEKRGYIPNLAKITDYFAEYPGMSGSSLQAVLKREGIAGDAYREIESISINPDGTYADAAEFKAGLERVMERYGLPRSVREEILALLQPVNNIGDADKLAKRWTGEIRVGIHLYRRMCQHHPSTLLLLA